MFSDSVINQKIQDQLQEAVLSVKADYAEIRAEESISTRVVYKGPDPELIAEPHSYGYFVRVLVNGSWGIATFTDFSQLKIKLSQAVEFAKLQGKGSVLLSETEQHVAHVVHNQLVDFRTVPLKKKVALVKNYNQILLKTTPAVKTTSVIYADNYLTKFFVNSKGSRIFQQRPYIRVAFQAMASNKDVIEMARGSHGHVGGYEVVEGYEPEMEKVAKQSVQVAKAPKVKSGNYTVILDPLMAGTFAHEAFGHFSEADHQYENPKILEQMQIGRKLGSEIVNIVDDPTISEGWGNFVFDDEGVIAKKTTLLSAGIITERLHSLETSKKLNEKPNGRARADGYHSKPIIRMSNTYFEKGKSKLKDMIATTKEGILIVSWLGGMTAMENFTFTAMHGVMIENGKLGNKVRGVKLMGNVFETLNNIDAVSDDFEQDQGTCGKEGQHMPVGSGGAYVRINNVTVGGE